MFFPIQLNLWLNLNGPAVLQAMCNRFTNPHEFVACRGFLEMMFFLFPR